MTTRIELPHDGWAELRDADEIPRTHAKALRKTMGRMANGTEVNPDGTVAAITTISDGEAMMVGLDDMKEALTFCAVSSWSYGPVDEVTIHSDVITDGVIDPIYDWAVEAGYMDTLVPDFGVNPDQDSPTEP